jgi:haloalkane dehalogenase
MVAAQPDRFDRVVISNTGLPYNPDGEQDIVERVMKFRATAKTPTLTELTRALKKIPDDQAIAFAYWQKFCWENEDLPVGFLMSASLESHSLLQMVPRVLARRLGLGSLRPFTDLGRAYEAPYPDPSYKMGPRAMPSQVPTLPTDPSLEAQRIAWEFFSRFEKPFLCAFTDDDPVTKGGDLPFREIVPGAKEQPHQTLAGGGHFSQENRPHELSEAIVGLVKATPEAASL